MSPYNKATLPPRLLVATCAVVFVFILVVDLGETLSSALRVSAGSGALIGVSWFTRIRRRFAKEADARL